MFVSINWAFNSGAEAFDYLAAGETLTLSYTVRVAVTDQNGNVSIGTREFDASAVCFEPTETGYHRYLPMVVR